MRKPGREKQEISREEGRCSYTNDIADLDLLPGEPQPLAVTQHLHLPSIRFIIGSVSFLINSSSSINVIHQH